MMDRESHECVYQSLIKVHDFDQIHNSKRGKIAHLFHAVTLQFI